jgi:hypothetical protein
MTKAFECHSADMGQYTQTQIHGREPLVNEFFPAEILLKVTRRLSSQQENGGEKRVIYYLIYFHSVN